MAHTIFTANKNMTNAATLTGLPNYMTDGELIGGRVVSSCALHTPVPGMPTMCVHVVPEFMHAIHAMATDSTCAYGSNTQSTMTEITINGAFYMCAYNSKKLYAQCNGAALKGKADLPARMIFLLSMPFLMGDKEFSEAFEQYKNSTDDDERKQLLAVMSDNAYFRDETNEVTLAFDTTNLLRMTDARAENPKYFPQTQVGTFKVFKNNNAGGAAPSGPLMATQSVMDATSFNKAFALVDENDLMPEERALVPVLDDRYIITQQHIDVCTTIQSSSGSAYQFDNYLFRGAPGGGKSTFIRIIAAGLGLPLYADVLRTTMDSDFFSGYFCPDTDGYQNVHPTLKALLDATPSPEDIAFDPVCSYQTITGQTSPSVTPAECMAAFAEKVIETQKNDGEVRDAEPKNALKFVEGLVPKLERPGIIFYDEVTVPNNPGVIAALNTLMDDQRMFTLTNGRVIHRHPQSIMCFAGNFGDVEGCREPNRAWQDRNKEIIDIDPPRPAELKSQLIAMTGYDSKKTPISKLTHSFQFCPSCRQSQQNIMAFVVLVLWRAGLPNQ